MPSQLNIPITVLLVIVSLTAMFAFASAGPLPVTAATVQVQHCRILSTGQCTVAIPLTTGEQIVGMASTGLGSGGAAKLWVTSPSNVTLYKTEIVNGSAAFLFTAFAAGAYSLHFDNLTDPPNGEVTVSFTSYPPADC